jgi:hypothetical protein
MEDDIRMPAWIPKVFYRLLLITGIIFYFSWLIIFGVEHWNDVGVYSITIVLVCFGLVGTLLYDEIEKKESEKEEKGEFDRRQY